MARNFILIASGLILALLGTLIAPQSVHARHMTPSCIAYGDLDEDFLASAIEPAGGWDCSSAAEPSMTSDRVYFRFDLNSDAKTPRSVLMRYSFMKNVQMAVLDQHGGWHAFEFDPDTLSTQLSGERTRVPVPTEIEGASQIIVALDEPTHRISLETVGLEAAITEGGDAKWAEDRDGQWRSMLLIAFLCGVLIMPLAFNVPFWRVLREEFVIWQSVMTIGLVVQVFVFSGLVNQVFTIGQNMQAALINLSIGCAISSAAMFVVRFIEPENLHPTAGKWLRWSALLWLVATVLHVAFPYILRSVQTDLYYALFIPMMILMIWVVGHAIHRGSRAVKFLAIGMAILLSVAPLRLLSQLTSILPSNDGEMLLYVGAVVQVFATAIGIADRFMLIKRERDRAQIDSEVLEKLASRDPLTGLLNRRALDERFEELHATGFETFALIDLDHFKIINDEFGHGTGDKVLEVIGSVLKNEPRSIAVRMGGEEFLLLLRGKDAAERAEQLRQALSLRIAREVEGLNHIVTASVGLLTMPHNAVPNASFSDVYARADKLLYEAKEQGRNRIVSERMRAFQQRSEDRRNPEAA